MFTNIGFPGLILILIIALVIFGPSKLPEMGRALGTSLKEFKRSSRGLIDDDPKEERGDKDSIADTPNRS